MSGKFTSLARIRKQDPAVVVFNVILFAVFVAGVIATMRMPFAHRMLPLSACLLGVVLCVVAFAKFLMGVDKVVDPAAEDDVLSTFDGKSEADDKATIRYGAWMLGYIAALWMTGLWISTIVFSAAFLRIEHRAGVLTIATVTGITLVTAYLLGLLLNVTWPTGLLSF